MSAVVGAVAQSILPTLKEANDDINAITFIYGREKEMIETIMQMDRSPSQRLKIWPAILLFTDISTVVSGRPGVYDESTLQMAVVYPTLPTYKCAERYTNTFEPILHPLWQELMKQIADSGCFVDPESKMQYTKWDRPYWGKQGNTLAAVVDAVELQNLKLKTVKGAAPRIVTPSEFFDSQFFDANFFE
jgi:hypothetical protein